MQQNSSDRITTGILFSLARKTENLRKLTAAQCPLQVEAGADNTDWCSDADNALH